MKIKSKLLITASFILATVSQTFSQGYIVPNGVTWLGYVEGVGGYGSYGITVIQNPTNGDYTGFFLNVTTGTNAYQFEPIVDEEVRTFLVSSNDPISLQPILAQNYTELLSMNSYTFADGSIFYLGFYTGYNPWDSQGNYTGIYTDPVFGWGEFVNNNGVIEMLDSGLEYDGGGIYAGTSSIISTPEPSEFVLIVVGASLLIFQCWKNDRRH